jgi:murein DD-endopeptidase MepM/ murein hydrolase activator NlpD
VTGRGATWFLALALAGVSPAQAGSGPIIAWSYIVQPGDTLASIAARMGVSAADLARVNGLPADARLTPGIEVKRPDPNDVTQGQRTMPNARRVPPPPRPALPRPAPPPPRPAPAPRPVPLPRPAPVPAPTAIPAPMPAPSRRPEPGAPRLVWPTSGAIVTRFGGDAHGRPDNGIDLAAFSGMTVRAAAAGRVIFAGTEPERFGQLIVIDHGQGWATAYAYLGKVMIREGMHVTAGTPIARIGATGEAKKPTLHFELRHDNVPHDPMPSLPIRL